MGKKLTLSIEHEVIEQAKQYASKHGRSLSNIVEEYLKSLGPTKKRPIKVTVDPIVEELFGSVRFQTKKKDKNLIQEALINKYM
jgi:hypothetical protein